MSNAGQAVLSIGGAALGFVIGGVPGAQLGYLLGSGAGSLLFPTDLGNVKGPRLNDLTVQTSTIGAPIPIVYGTFALAGNVIWSGGLIEVVNEDEQGGKGGGPSQTVTTYTYFVDCAVGICEGEIQGVRKIWADAKVIYDLTPQAEDETDEAYAERIAASEQTAALMTVYTGSETQLPDPTIESYEVAGAVPAFRGLAYVVFDNLPLADYGNRIPNLRFEVYTGTASDVDCTQYSAGHLEPWVEGGRDPRNDDNAHEYRFGAGTWRSTFAQGVADMEAGSGKSLFTSDTNLHGWQLTNGASQQSPCFSITTSDRIVLHLLYNVVDTTQRTCGLSGPGTNSCDIAFNIYGEGNVFWHPGSQNGLLVVVENSETEEQYFNGYSGSGSVSCGDSNHYITDIGDVALQVRRSIQPPSGCGDGTPISNAPGFCVAPDGSVTPSVTWTLTSGTFKVLQPYDDDGTFVTSYPVNPCLPLGHDDYSDQAFWEAAYAQALADGEPIDPGLTYGVDYPVVVSEAYVGECETTAVETECVSMASVVTDICARAGLAAIDVSDIGTAIHGYCITRVMSARDALAPLRTIGLFDAVESGSVLKFVERGHAAVATLAADDLAAHPYDSERPTSVEVTRVQEKELPRRLRLHYASQDRNYEAGEQSASRITTEAVTEQDVEVAAALCAGDEEAAQLAEILLYEAWVSRNTYRFALDNSWLAIEPTDCLVVPVDGQLERVRVVSCDYSIGGVIQVDAVRDDDGSYESTVVPSEPSPSGNQSGGSSSVICPSEAVFLDIPRLREADTDAGYYAGVYGLCDTWTCAAVYRSGDDGDNYRRVATTNTQATIGTITDIGPDTGDTSDTGTGDTSDTPLDYSVIIRVSLAHGTLSSTTGSGLAAGVNTAAIGAHGRWEIFQFRNAELITGDVWELRGLSRGLLGTDPNMAAVGDGDTFVLLSGPGIFRVPEECSQVGIEKLLKTPSCGESLAAVEAEEFTTEGLSCRTNLISEQPPNPGDVPIFNPDTGQYEPGCLLLRNLCDVEFDSSVQDGDVLTYDEASGGFVFEPVDSTSSGGSGDGYPAALGHSGI